MATAASRQAFKDSPLLEIKNFMADPVRASVYDVFKGNGLATENQGRADLLNTDHPTKTLIRKSVLAAEVRASLDKDEFAALLEGERDWIDTQLEEGVLDFNEPLIIDGFKDLFNAQSVTRASFLPRVSRPATEAEEMWGEGVFITAGQVAHSDNE